MVQQFLCCVTVVCLFLGCSPRRAAEDGTSLGSPPALPPLIEKGARVDYRARWAVIIGVDKYPGGESGLRPLLYAVNDARAVRDILREEFGYAPEHIKYIANEAVTRTSVREVFGAWLPGQHLHEDDSVLVFFAGHGFFDAQTNDGHLAAFDSLKDRKETCLSIAE